jgi:DNA-binding response OmpR family regulator
MDRDKMHVDVGGEAVNLTHQEYRLLAIFLRRPNVVVPSTQLCEILWGPAGRRELKRLSVVVSHLRAKLVRASPYMIENVRSRGYGLRARNL